MGADQHDLTALHDDVGLLDLRAARAYGLHLPAVERHPGFEFLLDEVVVIGFSVLDDAHGYANETPLGPHILAIVSCRA